VTPRRSFLAVTTLLLLIALALVAKVSLDRLAPPPWGNPVGDSLSPQIDAETRLGQQFPAPLPGLYRIELDLILPEESSHGNLVLHLRTAPNAANDLRTASLSLDEAANGRPYGFEFEPIRDSAGQSYYFFLEPSPPAAARDATVRYGPESVLEGASAYLNGEPLPGNLRFHSYYSLRTRERIDLLLTRMAAGRPYFLGTKGFYAGLALVYGLVLAIFVVQVARAMLEEAEGES
jgi:hypothetical protein